MSIVSRTILKSYFETGDTPTEANFEELIDSTLNLKDDDTDYLTEGVVNLYNRFPYGGSFGNILVKQSGVNYDPSADHNDKLVLKITNTKNNNDHTVIDGFLRINYNHE